MAPLTPESRRAIERLRSYRPATPGPWNELHHTRRAAVLLLLFADLKGSLRVVLTERSSSLRTFAGQVALPGGKADDDTETPEHTARREAEEEIGLPATAADLPPPFEVEYLCELPMNLSRNNLGVQPVVALLKSGKTENGREANAEESLIPRLDPKEVASVFTAPFEAFLQSNYESAEFEYPTSTKMVDKDIVAENKEVVEEEKEEKIPVGAGSIDEEGAAGWYTGYWIEWHNGVRWKMHEFHVPARPVVSRLASRLYSPPYPGADRKQGSSATGGGTGGGGGVHDRKLVRYRVWGLTARILVDAARVAYARNPDFECVEHFGDDDMIRELHQRGLMEERKRRGSRKEEEESGRVKLLKERAAGGKL